MDLIQDVAKLVDAYFFGYQLENGTNIYEYKKDNDGFHNITLFDKSTGFFGPSITYEKMGVIGFRDNSTEIIISLSQRFATKKDIMHGFKNCTSHDKIGNILHFHYEIDNIDQVRDLLKEYTEYFERIIKAKKRSV